MSDRKKQHWVPQFYFRNFGTATQVALYNIKTKRHIPGASIRDQCQRDWTYGRNLKAEEGLGIIEGVAAEAIRSVLSTLQPPKRGTPGHFHLLQFVVLQWARTPQAGANTERFMTANLRSILKTDPLLPEHLRSAVDSIEMKSSAPALASLLAVADMGPLLVDLSMCVLRGEGAQEFVTSDAPVIFYNHWTKTAVRPIASGMASAGLMVFFPLSPTVCFLLYDPSVYLVGDASRRTESVLLNESDIRGLNTLQAFEAEDNLYYSGNPLASRQIDSLPWSGRERTRHPIAVQVFEDHDGGNLVGVSRLTHRFRLAPSYFRVRRKMKDVAPVDRCRRSREGVPELAEHIESKRPARPHRAARLPSSRLKIKSLRPSEVSVDGLRLLDATEQHDP